MEGKLQQPLFRSKKRDFLRGLTGVGVGVASVILGFRALLSLPPSFEYFLLPSRPTLLLPQTPLFLRCHEIFKMSILIPISPYDG